MCGIYTEVFKSGEINFPKCLNILGGLKKRGPDWSFYKAINNIFFGQTVLSMAGKKEKNISNHISRSGRFFLLFNGEIYNYKFLEKKYSLNLKKNFSDTQVLVNLFDKKDIKEIIDELDGMYAFIIYDKIKKKIFFTRDTQGEKTLYFYEDSEKFAISSEASSFINTGFNQQVDKSGLQSYLNSRHFLQLRNTCYKKIKNILPGETIELNLNNFKKKIINTKDISEYISEKTYLENKKKTVDELAAELERLLEKNLTEMIPKGRKYCSILSGGIDSTLVSKMLENISKPEFFISLNHLGKDKISNQINKFQKFFKHDINLINVTLENYYHNLKDSLKICSSPINSHDFPGKLIIAREVKNKGCKAIFGGDGADELFGGYSTYFANIKNYKLNNSEYSRFIKNKIKLSIKGELYFKNKLEFLWSNYTKAYQFLGKDEMSRQTMMLLDTALQLSSVGMRGTDLMFMSSAIEPRSVFLRKDIIKFALNLPLKFKVDLTGKEKIRSKILLKKIFIKYFPKEFIFKKQGFSGFPNETKKFLGKPKNFFINQIIKPKNILKSFNKLKKTDQWKLINLEHFYRGIIN
ncbi:asparagine synthase-related protein [Pelagibacteraceae bacterium]|jgi:asparagine synthase (glutamine-hydrolysing)|nr:asparagine synthase-related protein [Pelagibacteraceae bacterium]